MVEDATKGIAFGKNDLDDFKKVKAEVAKKQEQDMIKFLEQRGYRVMTNNTCSNQQRDERMIKILETVGYIVTKEEKW